MHCWQNKLDIPLVLTWRIWSEDVQVGYSAIVFYGYVGVIGLALWAMLKWWFKSEVGACASVVHLRCAPA